MDKKGFAHLVVGMTGEGKTTYVKHFLRAIKDKKRIIVYDVNNEYQDVYPYPFLDIDDFMPKLMDSYYNVIVLEESTIFFNNRGHDKNLERLLVRKRHQFNYILLCFHSLRAIPRYVWDLTTYLTLFKTNDNEGFIIKEKLPSDAVLKTFREVRDNKGLTKIKIPNTNKFVYFKTVKI